MIGVPDLDWGEVVKAVIVLAPGESVTVDEVVEYSKKQLASYKAPQYVAVTDTLPRNVMGKVLKNDLRQVFGEPKNDNVS